MSKTITNEAPLTHHRGQKLDELYQSIVQDFPQLKPALDIIKGATLAPLRQLCRFSCDSRKALNGEDKLNKNRVKRERAALRLAGEKAALSEVHQDWDAADAEGDLTLFRPGEAAIIKGHRNSQIEGQSVTIAQKLKVDRYLVSCADWGTRTEKVHARFLRPITKK
jgi:hypothetical protein